MYIRLLTLTGVTPLSHLKESMTYIGFQFKMHVKYESRISDHCQVHALSDPQNPRFFHFSANHEHVHDLACGNCKMVKSVLSELQTAVSEAQYPTDDEQLESIYLTSTSIEAINA